MLFSLALSAALLLFISSCGTEQSQLSISQDKLVEVLIDVHIAEAAAQTLRGATKDSVINAYYDQIFEIHGLNREEFETSMELLRTDPKRMEKLYAKVMEEMERQDVEDKE